MLRKENIKHVKLTIIKQCIRNTRQWEKKEIQVIITKNVVSYNNTNGLKAKNLLRNRLKRKNTYKEISLVSSIDINLVTLITIVLISSISISTLSMMITL